MTKREAEREKASRLLAYARKVHRLKHLAKEYLRAHERRPLPKEFWIRPILSVFHGRKLNFDDSTKDADDNIYLEKFFIEAANSAQSLLTPEDMNLVSLFDK